MIYHDPYLLYLYQKNEHEMKRKERKVSIYNIDRRRVDSLVSSWLFFS